MTGKIYRQVSAKMGAQIKHGRERVVTAEGMGEKIKEKEKLQIILKLSSFDFKNNILILHASPPTMGINMGKNRLKLSDT